MRVRVMLFAFACFVFVGSYGRLLFVRLCVCVCVLAWLSVWLLFCVFVVVCVFRWVCVVVCLCKLALLCLVCVC